MNKVIIRNISKLSVWNNVVGILQLISNIIEDIKDFNQKHGLDAGFDVFLNRYVVFHKGRSFLISLVTKSRIGASLNLSRRLCGSGAGDEAQPGQSRCFEPQRTQRKAEKSRDYSGFMKGFQCLPAGDNGEPCGASSPILNNKHTLQLRGGSGVDAPALYFGNGDVREIRRCRT